MFSAFFRDSISHIFHLYRLFLTSKSPSFWKALVTKNVKSVFKKHYANRSFEECLFFRNIKKPGSLIANWCLTKERRFFQTISVFIALKPRFFSRNLVFENCPILCPFFGGFTNWAKMVHTVASQLQQNNPKPLKPLFLCRNVVFVAKQRKTILASGWWKQKALIGHIGVFGPKNGLLQKRKGDVSNTTSFRRFWGVYSWCCNPFFLPFGFFFYMFLLFVLALLLLVVVLKS